MECEIEIQKPEIRKQSKTFRNWRKVDVPKFCDELNLEEFDYSVTDLETFWKSYNEKLENTVNVMVCEKTIKITFRDLQPWYDETLHDQERSIHRRLVIWKRYHEQHQWKAYCTE